MRSFLGLNYYRRFLPNLASVLQPLNQLLEKNTKWCWTRQCVEAFRQLVLTHSNPEFPVKLACDASSYGLGAVLSHVLGDGSERPVAFVSRALSSAVKKNYSQIDKEALALVCMSDYSNTPSSCLVIGMTLNLNRRHSTPRLMDYQRLSKARMNG